MSTRLILSENGADSQLALLLEALGVLFERISSLDEALAFQSRDEGDTTALILWEEQLIAARALAAALSVSHRTLCPLRSG